MRAKLTALVLAVAGVASSLLAVRQQRIEAAHDLAETHRRIMASDESLLRLRTAIAARTEPEQVRAMLDELGETAPIYMDWCAPAAARGLAVSPLLWQEEMLAAQSGWSRAGEVGGDG